MFLCVLTVRACDTSLSTVGSEANLAVAHFAPLITWVHLADTPV